MVAAAMNSGARTRSSTIYVWLAGACVLMAFGGFAGTYWLQLAAGSFVGGTLLLHLHASLFFAWTLLLLSQTWLAANGRLEHHRAWGLVGLSLGTAMVLVGLALANRSVGHYLAQGYGDRARAFYVLPFGSIGLFAVFLAAAIANISRPDWHKRFMIVATVSLLQAAAARIGFLLATGGGPGARPGLSAPVPPEFGIRALAMVSPILIAGVIYDWRTRGRPHPAYLIGLGALFAVAITSQWFTATAGWRGFVDLMQSFGT
jgi:hypothetical protein